MLLGTHDIGAGGRLQDTGRLRVGICALGSGARARAAGRQPPGAASAGLCMSCQSSQDVSCHAQECKGAVMRQGLVKPLNNLSRQSSQDVSCRAQECKGAVMRQGLVKPSDNELPQGRTC